MSWFLAHVGDVWTLLWQHAELAAVPLVLGLVIALPLGWLARRHRAIQAPLVGLAGLLYTIPSLALFILMPLVLGTGILDPLNVIVALTVYTVALLVRTVSDALGSVPDETAQAATAMGFSGLRRFFTVDLPLATPVIAAGLRVAAVSNVSIVSVAALIGVPQLGSLFTDGFSRTFTTEIVIGIIACVVLAAVFDLLILGLTWLLTPWAHAGGRTARVRTARSAA